MHTPLRDDLPWAVSPAWPGAESEQTVEAGPWRLTLRGSEVADVAHDGVTVLRAVRFVTRDHDWRTADDTDVRTAVTPTPSGARVRIDAASGFDGSPVLAYGIDLVVDGDELRVEATARTIVPFRRNRVGLVVLHPPTLAGTPVTVRHPTAPATEVVLPTWIAPHQPAVDVAGYAWQVDDRACTLDLDGDVFEMEDQRNWTDASYKTYSTPLAEPFPVALPAGTVVRHALTLRVAHRPGGTARPAADLAALDGPAPTPGRTSAPVVQYTASSAPAAERPDDADLPRPAAVLVEPDLDRPDVGAVLARARRDARGASLDVRFVTDDPAALRAALDDLLATGAVARVGAFDPRTHGTTPPLQRALHDAATAVGGLEVVAGTRAHFTELNRTVDLHRSWDGPLAFSVTPQMHDRSRAQVTESLRMLRWVAMSASRLAAGRPLHVGPVTLRPRFNAVATSAVPHLADPDDADATDPDQHSAAARAWTDAAVRALSVPGVATVTVGEVWGPRGLVPGRRR